MKEMLLNMLGSLNYFYVSIIIVNIVIFIFAKFIINFLDTTSLERRKVGERERNKIRKKTVILRFLSAIILCAYIVTLVIKAGFLNDVISSLFVIIVAYISNSWILKRLLLFYGDEIEVSGETYIRRDYKINLFSLLVTFFTVLIGLFFIFKIFGIDSILQSGGIIAGMLAFFGFTAPVWAPDLVAGISILHNDQVEIGNVIEIPELGILAWVKNLNLSEVKLIDLSLGHPIVMRPSKFRELKVENLSLGVAGKKIKIMQYLDADIGYEHDEDSVKNIFFSAWEEMIESVPKNAIEQKYFSENAIQKLEIVEFGNYAVKYRFFYEISSPFYILKVRFLLNKYLKISQKKYGIDFSTPQLVNLDK